MKHAACLLLMLTLTAPVATAQPDTDAPPRIDLTPDPRFTVFDGPLLPDGRIDYIAAMNEHTRKGVTHENNAFRAMFLLMPLDDEEEFDPDEPSLTAIMSDKLEVTQQERDRTAPLVGWYEFAEAKGLSLDEIIDVEDSSYEFDFAHPQIDVFKQWLSSQEPGFKQLVAAIKLPKYWRPQIEDIQSPGSGQFALVPFTGKHRRLAVMLDRRARYALSQGNHEVFIESVASINRLADHVAQGPFYIDRLVANSIEFLAIDLLHYSLRNHKLGADDLALLQQVIGHRTPWPPMAEIVAFGEHVYAVSYFIAHATGKDSLGRLYEGFLFASIDSSALDDAIQKVGVDLEAGLRLIERKMKLDAAAWKSETLKDYIKMEQVSNSLWHPRWEALKEKHIVEDEDRERRIKVPRSARNPVALAELIVELPNVLMGDLFDSLGHAVYTFDARRQVSEAAIALERYRLANGNYPDRLEDLIPDYRRELPIDPIDGEPLRYRLEDDGTAVVYSINKNLKDDGGTTDPDDPDAVADGDYVWRLEPPAD